MGYYINPPDMTKEKFLEKHGEVFTPGADIDFNADKVPVCLVTNVDMGFTAAGICYDDYEYKGFNQPHDYRPKKWYMVARELLKPYCNRL